MNDVIKQTPPKFLYLEITSECNFHCKHCHIWMNNDNNTFKLSLNEKLDIIRQFKLLNPKGIVVFTGGEVMLKEEEFFSISKYCRDNEIFSSGVSNASIMNENNYERGLIEGPNFIQISLDSHIETIHDYIRGIKGAYKHTINVLKSLMLLKEERKNENDSKIIINHVLFDKNYSDIISFIEFLKENNLADGITLSCLIPTLQNRGEDRDFFFENHSIKNKSKSIDILNEVILKYEHDSFLNMTKAELELFKLYISDSKALHKQYQVCDSLEKNLIIDLYGNTRLCFHMYEMEDISKMNNTRNNSLYDIWYSSEVTNNRTVLKDCRRDCAVLSCHRKSDIFNE